MNPRMSVWPRWGRKGFYAGPRNDAKEFYWTCNEGEYPNFCIRLQKWHWLFFYVAIAPGLRCHFNLGKWRNLEGDA